METLSSFGSQLVFFFTYAAVIIALALGIRSEMSGSTDVYIPQYTACQFDLYPNDMRSCTNTTSSSPSVMWTASIQGEIDNLIGTVGLYAYIPTQNSSIRSSDSIVYDVSVKACTTSCGWGGTYYEVLELHNATDQISYDYLSQQEKFSFFSIFQNQETLANIGMYN